MWRIYFVRCLVIRKFVQSLKGSVLAHLRCIPALLSVYDAFQLSEELRTALILALLSPDVFKTEIDHSDEDLQSISVLKTFGLNKASMRALLSSSDNWRAL